MDVRARASGAHRVAPPAAPAPPESATGRWDRLVRSAPPLGTVTALWSAAWITAFVDGAWTVGLPMLLLTGPVSALGWRWRRAAKRSRRRRDAEQRAAREAWRPPVPPPAPDSPELALQRRVSSAVVRAEAAAGHLDADALALVRELTGLLEPLLVRVRAAEVDAGVRHDASAIAGEHLPAVLDAYLSLPPAVQRAAGADGRTPADVLRAHLLLLVEGARELERSVVHADLARQQQLGRFLDAKFRRSDLAP